MSFLCDITRHWWSMPSSINFLRVTNWYSINNIKWGKCESDSLQPSRMSFILWKAMEDKLKQNILSYINISLFTTSICLTHWNNKIQIKFSLSHANISLGHETNTPLNTKNVICYTFPKCTTSIIYWKGIVYCHNIKHSCS